MPNPLLTRGDAGSSASHNLWLRVAVLGTVMLAALAGPPPAQAANVLSNGSVSPGSGTTATLFTFRVDFDSEPPRTPQSVRAEVTRTSDGAIVNVPLTLESGEPTAGTWAGTSTLAAGTWQLRFRAQAPTGVPDHPVAGSIVVSDPQPSPTASPTPSPEPTPTEPGLPSPDPTAPPPPGTSPVASPNPPQPGPVPPGRPAPTPSRSPAPAAPSASVLLITPAPTPADGETDRPSASSGGSELPSASPSSAAGAGAEPSSGSRTVMPWLLLGGGMATTGATVLAAQWIAWRRKRR